ncbi:MAG: hypothetical protein MUO63_03280 [Desulfobulbaceae bacterium]|nr:hypothetical protein [Desulfobulbaceae bacterium]
MSNKFAGACNYEKNKISIKILISVIACSLAYIGLNFDNPQSLELPVFFTFMATYLHFSFVGLRNKGGYDSKMLADQKVESFLLGFSQAWKSKYHWGTMLQLICLIYIKII